MSQWIIVSNRLPFNYDSSKKKVVESSGGLVTAIRGIKSNHKMTWVGIASENLRKEKLPQSKSSTKYSVIKVSDKLYNSYYNNFCNDVLWPILHYEQEITKFDTESWDDYCKVNRIFAEHIAKIAQKDDLIWLHDFHLFMVPHYLYKLRPELKTGLFLHVPFPSSEIYRQLPWREKLLESLLCTDLIGFQDFSYLRHFASSVYNILGIHTELLDVDGPYKHTKLGIYPVSIDTKSFINKAENKKTQQMIEKYDLNNGLKYILGVDRLDYTKGLILKLKAFQRFLELHPNFIGKVQLIQIAVPSRTDVEEYINLRYEVERLVSQINGEFGSINYTPIKYIFNSVSSYELMALYRSSNVLFVTSKRDGMNLVCLEYVAAQDQGNPGVVLLSEFAGAASSLSHATLINPTDTTDTAIKLASALKKDLKSRRNNHSTMLKYLKQYTANTWASSFLESLKSGKYNNQRKTKILDYEISLKEIKSKIGKKKRVLILDFDGTLTPIVSRPEDAKLPDNMKKLLSQIAKDPKNMLVVLSGRPHDFLQKQLKGIDCYYACEHGARFFDKNLKRWRNLVSSNKKVWYADALDIIEDYTRRTPNSSFEKKNYAITWHYRNSPTEFGNFQARKLVTELESGLGHLPVTVMEGKKVIEIKSLEANKGYFVEWFLSRYTTPNDIVFAMGDDKTDEDMFESLSDFGITVKIGDDINTKAQYYLKHQKNVPEVLKRLF